MQTGTTPARRIATEPASDRSAPSTGPCRTATTAPDAPHAPHALAAPVATPPTAIAGVDPAPFAEVAA